ncbi:MAG: Gfo/Idh/MocA family oxidoreductase, partial [Actinobacteria bacterium]|nr:Gfo/Idh/MocA family oxidoreductase [Actinomycetota bacterium]
MTGIVVTGAGKIGSRHLSAYQSIPESTVVGVVEPDDATFAAASSTRVGGLERFITLEEALDHPAVDVIDICTPTPLHFKQAEAALRSGKSVFCEKPLVTSPTEIDALVSMLTRESTFRVGYPYRYHPRIVRLKHRLDRGALGTPHMA